MNEFNIVTIESVFYVHEIKAYTPLLRFTVDLSKNNKS